MIPPAGSTSYFTIYYRTVRIYGNAHIFFYDTWVLIIATTVQWNTQSFDIQSPHEFISIAAAFRLRGCCVWKVRERGSGCPVRGMSGPAYSGLPKRTRKPATALVSPQPPPHSILPLHHHSYRHACQEALPIPGRHRRPVQLRCSPHSRAMCPMPSTVLRQSSNAGAPLVQRFRRLQAAGLQPE